MLIALWLTLGFVGVPLYLVRQWKRLDKPRPTRLSESAFQAEFDVHMHDLEHMLAKHAANTETAASAEQREVAERQLDEFLTEWWRVQAESERGVEEIEAFLRKGA